MDRIGDRPGEGHVASEAVTHNPGRRGKSPTQARQGAAADDLKPAASNRHFTTGSVGFLVDDVHEATAELRSVGDEPAGRDTADPQAPMPEQAHRLKRTQLVNK
jgi:hypothetical protein